MKVWVYWHNWEEAPAYVRMCVENMGKYCKELMEVSDANLGEFLPNLRDGLTVLPHFQRAEYIRTQLLKRYGGLWLDADTWVIKDLEFIGELLKVNDFVCFREEHNLVDVSIMGSAPLGTIIQEYIFRQDLSLGITGLKEKLVLGARLLTHIINMLEGNIKVYHLPMKIVYPVQYHEIGKFMEEKDPIMDLGEIVCFKLYNRGFPDNWKSRTRAEVLKGDVMLSRLMKKGFDNAE